MTYLEGVYWDLDGTIANTELEAHLPAFNNAFNDLGIDWNWDTNKYIKLLKINGGKNRIAYYAKSNNDDLSEDFILKIHETKQYHYLEIIIIRFSIISNPIFASIYLQKFYVFISVPIPINTKVIESIIKSR